MDNEQSTQSLLLVSLFCLLPGFEGPEGGEVRGNFQCIRGMMASYATTLVTAMESITNCRVKAGCTGLSSSPTDCLHMSTR